MRFVIQLLVVSFLFTALESGFEAHAQATGAAASHDEEEDLRKTVRELALRVSALEEELHRQRAATPVDSVSLKPPAPVLSLGTAFRNFIGQWPRPKILDSLAHAGGVVANGPRPLFWNGSGLSGGMASTGGDKDRWR